MIVDMGVFLFPDLLRTSFLAGSAILGGTHIIQVLSVPLAFRAVQFPALDPRHQVSHTMRLEYPIKVLAKRMLKSPESHREPYRAGISLLTENTKPCNLPHHPRQKISETRISVGCIAISATHALALAQVSGLCKTFRSTQTDLIWGMCSKHCHAQKLSGNKAQRRSHQFLGNASHALVAC